MVAPAGTACMEATKIETDLMLPESQWSLFFEDLRLPGDALVGQTGRRYLRAVAGLNPERVVASAIAIGQARFALENAAHYAKERTL